MCKQLIDLTRFVQDKNTNATVRDVIRIACASCDQIDVCVAVNAREFELRESFGEEERR